MTKLNPFHWALLILALIALALSLGGMRLNAIAHTGAAYKAKVACSEIFLAGRTSKAVLASDFDNIDPLLDRMPVTVDDARRQTVAAGPAGLGRAKAIYRDGYGCTLENQKPLAALPALAPVTNEPWSDATINSDHTITRVDTKKLNALIEAAFADSAAGNRALLVAVDGEVVAEGYADGISKTTRLASWSMAKSVTATVLGAAVLQGLVELDDPAPVREWQGDAARSKITWSDLLHMQSGLAFDENYAGMRSDVNLMLFHEADAGAYAADKPAIYPPGEHWAYSSGTVNLLARTLRQVLEDAGADYYTFARNAIYAPIGAASITMEPDASGTPIGSSYVYATARDWARLGELYLRGGVWGERRILPVGWSDYVAIPVTASDNQYGAYFWLNRDGKPAREGGQDETARARFVPGLPQDAYFMSGHEGQFVFIIPSKNMVIVRTGITRGTPAIAASAPLIAALYDAVGEPAATPEQ
jgi:CubicO group peptidase (beta-lactamase class C family)